MSYVSLCDGAEGFKVLGCVCGVWGSPRVCREGKGCRSAGAAGLGGGSNHKLAELFDELCTHYAEKCFVFLGNQTN